jgi:hypothetical protein
MKKKQETKMIPDAWQRFERAVDIVAKSPPQHRISKQAKKKKRAKRASSSKP